MRYTKWYTHRHFAGMRCAVARLLKRSFLLLGFLSLPASVPAQVNRNAVSVTGTVLSEGQNQRIQHTRVRLCDSGGNLLEETITSDDGEFFFRNLQRNPYILKFEANGYQNYEMHLDLSFMSERGMSIYLKPLPKDPSFSPPGATVSAHELSMPQSARNLVQSGKQKVYAHKNPESGLLDFQKAVARAPGYYEAYGEMAMAYVTLGKADEAIKSFRKSIEVSGDTYGDAEIGLGTLLIEKGELDPGEKALDRGVQLNPNSWRGFYELGKLDLGRGQLDSAQRSAEQAKSLAPNAPIVYRLLANIHMQRKDYVDLLEDLNNYIKLDPDSPAGVRAAQMRKQVAQQVAKQGDPSAPEAKSH